MSLAKDSISKIPFLRINVSARVLNAFAQVPSGIIETTSFFGNSDNVGRAYSRLVLIDDRTEIAQIGINLFASLLNSPKVTERDFQRFFELHPEFLLGDEYDSYWAEPTLRSPVTNRSIRPDFVLQPYAIRDAVWNWAVVDLKQPGVSLTRNRDFHQDFSRHVYKVVTQLKDYGEFFADPRNQEVIRTRFGGLVPVPKMMAVIGRLPDQHLDRYATLRSRLTGVSITTYDEILEFRKAKVDSMKSFKN